MAVAEGPVESGGVGGCLELLPRCSAQLGIPPPWPTQAAALEAIPADGSRTFAGNLLRGGVEEEEGFGEGTVEYTAVHLGPLGAGVRINTLAEMPEVSNPGCKGHMDLGQVEGHS